jgi:uncharacterized protein
MSIENGKKAIDCFIHLSEGAEVLDFSFTGGEPTLEFRLLADLIEYAVARSNEQGMGARISIKTNGTLLNEAHYECLKKFKCTVFVSLDGTEDDNNAFRVLNGRNSYQTVSARVAALLENELDVVVSMTIHPKSAKNVLQGVVNLSGLGVSRINIAPAYGTVDWTHENIDSFIDSLTQVAHWIRHNRNKLQNLDIGPIYQHSEHHANTLQNVWGCGAGSTNIAFLPDGDIYGCSSLAMIAANRPDLALGSAGLGIDQSKLNGFLETALANEVARNKCSTCGSRTNCCGGCLAINYSTSAAPFTPPEIYCRTIASIEKLWNIAWT